MVSRWAPTMGVPKTGLLVLHRVPEEGKQGGFGIAARLPAWSVQNSREGHSEEPPPEVWESLSTCKPLLSPRVAHLTMSTGLRTMGFWRKQPPERSWY